MNVQEMHIAVNQGVDKIHSFQADLILPEEIDIELNKNIHRFISQRFNSKGNKYGVGFEESQKRIDDLRTLLTEVDLLPLYKEQILSNIFVDTVAFPIDYYHLIRVSARTNVYKCRRILTSTEEIDGFQYIAVPSTALYNASNGFATTVNIASDDTYLGLGTSILNAVDEVPNFENLDAVITYLTDPVNLVPGIEVYWQQYNQVFAANNFIIIANPNTFESLADTAGVLNANTIIHTVLGDTTNLAYVAASPSDYTRVIDPSSGYGLADMTPGVYAAKFSQHDDIYKMLGDPFNKTSHKAPLYTITDNKLELYSNDIFIIDNVKMLYIRKPATVSLSLQVNCDLPDNVHQEIVDMTVATILGNISDPRYQIGSVERLQSE
tara:strand:+ start:927 stop:2066 length:1140 start_codon:yes stop_codon:yes gene_type:complete